MVFSSLLFLFAFLPITLSVYWALPARFRNAVCLLASCFFYAWGGPRFIFVLLVSGTLNYIIGRKMGPAGTRDDRRRRLFLTLGVILNVGLLGYFKYANFFVDDINLLLGHCGIRPVAWIRVALPVGISFFTFQKLSYLVDVYRGAAEPSTSYPAFLLYVFLFPQLIAGPIVRYHDVAAQLARRPFQPERVFSGILKFAQGLGKKALIANTLAVAADAVFNAKPSELSPLAAWMGVLCYSFQIYFDFSGYSDMAIGIGRMLGFDFLENFNHPYISKNFTEFWRRWHISLSNWMREYLYIPLGGNRLGRFRTYANLWIVFFLSGLWHGAAWNFIVWGIFHGTFMTFNKFTASLRLRAPPAWLATPVTFVFVTLGWVPFRADSLPNALCMLRQMLVAPWIGSARPSLPEAFGPDVLVVLAVAAAVSFLPAFRFSWARRSPALIRPSIVTIGRFVGALALLVVSASALASGSFNPFIYFRF